MFFNVGQEGRWSFCMVNINEILCGVGYWEGALHMSVLCILEKAHCIADAECLLENNCHGLICIFFYFL